MLFRAFPTFLLEQHGRLFVSRPSNSTRAGWHSACKLHTRCHGTAPKEPWNYGPAFVDEFRRIDDLKYELMPDVYAQAKDCSEHGLPMLRALFIEYPNDPGSWRVDDEYMYGSVLAAPLFQENATGRETFRRGYGLIPDRQSLRRRLASHREPQGRFLS